MLRPSVKLSESRPLCTDLCLASERIKAHGGKEAGFSMAEGKAMVDDLMQAAKL